MPTQHVRRGCNENARAFAGGNAKWHSHLRQQFGDFLFVLQTRNTFVMQPNKWFPLYLPKGVENTDTQILAIGCLQQLLSYLPKSGSNQDVCHSRSERLNKIVQTGHSLLLSAKRK
jgi:hypothetical protein